MREDILQRKDEIIAWISQNQSKAFICKQLLCKPETLNSYLEKMDIVYEGNKGSKGKPSKQYKTAVEYAQSNGVIKSHILKEKMIKDGIKERKCEICGLTEWQGINIPLELHHKNGNHYDNNFENLQILCPNCHAIQQGNSGANTLLVKEMIKKHHCVDCGIEISRGATRCKSCAAKIIMQDRRIVMNRPTREELKEMIRTQSFCSIAKKYGVTDNAVRKWCRTEKLPSTKKEIITYSDEAWQKI